MRYTYILKNYIFPPGIWKVLKEQKQRLLRRRALYYHHSFERQSLPREKGRCFVLASGPSVLGQDLTLLKDEDVIAVSHFHKHKDIREIRPKYHVLAPFHHPFTFKDAKKYFEDFLKAYDPKFTKIFLGYRPYKYSFHEFLKNNKKYEDFSFFTIDYSTSSQLDSKNFRKDEVWDIYGKPFECRTVVYSAIQLAYNLGYTEIFLIGCDHDYLFSEMRENGNRFYNDKDGIDDKEHLNSFDKERWFYEYYMRWKQYRLMREFLDSKNVKVINATKGGCLDVFERVKYESLF